MKWIARIYLRSGETMFYHAEHMNDIVLSGDGFQVYGTHISAYFPMEIIKYIEWEKWEDDK